MRRPILALLVALILAACAAAEPTEPAPTATPLPSETPQTPTAAPSPTATAQPAVAPPTAEPTAAGPPTNPLTGLPLDDPGALDRRPLLVKVSNESSEIRPLSGYGFADHLWLHQAEGWGQTRFTAVFLGQVPEYVGSVRSVRPIDSDILIPMYDGLLAYSGASIGMNYHFEFETPYWERAFRELAERDHLVRLEDVPRPGVDRYHRLFAYPERVWALAEERGNAAAEVDLTGLAFSEEPPAGGSPTTEVEVFLEENLGGIFRFAYEEGEWLFFHTDRKMVEPQEMPEIDRLTGEQLAFANVVILYVEHSYTGWIEDQASSSSALNTELTGEGSGYLVRDGQVYDIVWRNDPAEEGHLVELLDGEGDLIPLRPGQTMFFAVQSPEQLGFRFYAPTITFR